MYESPISILEIADSVIKKQNELLENNLIYEIKQKYYINIDKEELIKALQYDREQYDKGYHDGKAEGKKKGRWIINSDGYYPYCSECKYEPKEMTHYCPDCGAEMNGDIYES